MAEIRFREETTSQEEDLLIQRFIIGLNVLRKNINLYPPGHSIVNRFGDALSMLVNDIFSRFSNITINAIKSNLLVNGMLIDTKSAPVHDFALYISRLGIASLTMDSGLSMIEIEHFYRLAQKVPPKNHIYQYQNILDEINSLANIKIREIDLSAVRFIDEDVVDSTKTREPVSIKQKLLLSCLSPDLLNTQDADLLKIIRIYDKDSFNSFIRTFNIPAERLVQGYSAVLRNYFQDASEDEEVIREKQELFRSIQKSFNQFEPNLKEKILLTTFDAINKSSDEKSLEEFLSCMPGDMVVEVLTQAILDKRIISPALIKLLGVLYRAGKDYPAMTSPNKQGILDNPVWERIEELFSRAGYEKYLSEEYAEQLQNLSLEANKARNGCPVGFESEDYAAAFNEKSINRRLTSALLFLMQRTIEAQIFADYANNIARIIPELLEAKDYEHLVTIYGALHRHLDEARGPLVYNAALKTMSLYMEDSFTARLAEDYKTTADDQQPELEELIMLNADKNLPWLLGEYLKQKNSFKMEHLYNLLCRFGSKAAGLALNKLPAGNREETIALLKLIRGCNIKTSGPQIHGLLRNKDVEIQLEAVKTLLHIGDRAVIPALRKLVRAKDKQRSYQIFQIIHDYHVEQIAPELASLIKTFYITENSFDNNKAVLSLLASLGNSDALPVLKRKTKATITISPRYRRLTIEYLYASLAGYPKQATGELIRRGHRSRNERIRAICEELKSMS